MSSLLRVSVADWKKDKAYYCKAGYTPNEIVTVKIQKSQFLNLISLVPSPEDVQSQATAVLGCMIYGFHHRKFNIAWKKDGLIQTGNIVPSTSRSNASSETFTYLSMPMKDWINKSEYTCEVKHPYGFSKMVSMRYADELSVFIQNPDIEEIWISKTATVKCMVLCTDPQEINISWLVNGTKSRNPVFSEQPESKGIVKIVISTMNSSVEEWLSGVEYECVIEDFSTSAQMSAKTKRTKGTTKRPNIRLLPPPEEEIKSNSTAVLECVVSGFYPDHITVTWEKDSSVISSSTSPTPTALEQGGTFSVRHFLTVSVQEWETESVFSCTVTHPPSNTRIKKQVKNVQGAPSDPMRELSVFIQNPDIEEIWISKTATVKCMVLCTDPGEINISWLVNGTKSKNPVFSEQPESKGIIKIVISTMNSSVEEWLSGVEYKCVIQDLSTSTQMSAKTKSTKGTTKRPNIRLLPPPEEEIKSNSAAVLECVVSGFYPDHITVTWEKDSSVISSSTSPTPTALEQGGTFSVRHFLTVSVQEWETESVFSCTVIHPPSNTRIKKQVKNVQGAPSDPMKELSVFIQNPDIEEIWISKTATVKCMVLCTDPGEINISWLVNGTKSKNPVFSEQPESKGIIKIVISTMNSTAEEWLSGVEYKCVIQDLSTSTQMSAKTKSTKGTTKRPNIRLLPPPEEEIKSNSTAVLECVVSGFYPDHITVTWEKDSSVISSSTSPTPTALEQGGTFSVRHFLTVSVQEWETESVFSCTVTHPPSNTRIKKQVKNVQGAPSDPTKDTD
ncbi:uncharacterized protein [Mobula birostris]|uniref:uncharacterized protein n=1 Tax=Mobula birostris TaxID=1983395 RepID=UPI003B27D242